MNKQLAIQVATKIKNRWVREIQSRPGFSERITKNTPDITVLQGPIKSNFVPQPAFSRTEIRRPRFEKLNPDKGILLFLKTIYNHPLLPSFKHYLMLTNNKLTSFSTLRTDLVYKYQLIKPDYRVTTLGRQLLAAYDLATPI